VSGTNGGANGADGNPNADRNPKEEAMSEEVSIHRSTVRLEKPIYDVLVGVAMENHLHTPRRGPNITAAVRWLVLDWQQLRSESRGREAT
jgi:predicted DNA-binding ribbon-helix-helix protein